MRSYGQLAPCRQTQALNPWHIVVRSLHILATYCVYVWIHTWRLSLYQPTAWPYGICECQTILHMVAYGSLLIAAVVCTSLIPRLPGLFSVQHWKPGNRAWECDYTQMCPVAVRAHPYCSMHTAHCQIMECAEPKLVNTYHYDLMVSQCFIAADKYNIR